MFTKWYSALPLLCGHVPPKFSPLARYGVSFVCSNLVLYSGTPSIQCCMSCHVFLNRVIEPRKPNQYCMVGMSRVTHTCNESRKSLLYVICLIHQPSTFSSLEVVKMTLSTVTPFGAASEENFVKMTFPFQ